MSQIENILNPKNENPNEKLRINRKDLYVKKINKPCITFYKGENIGQIKVISDVIAQREKRVPSSPLFSRHS